LCRTNTQTQDHSIYCASIASRGKNCWLNIYVLSRYSGSKGENALCLKQQDLSIRATTSLAEIIPGCMRKKTKHEAVIDVQLALPAPKLKFILVMA